MFPVEGAPFFFNFTDDNQKSSPVNLLQATKLLSWLKWMEYL